MAVCYRHSSRQTGVSCSSCGRPICPDCMTPTPVGMRCPDCARERTKVRTVRTPRAGVGIVGRSVTEILIAINLIVFLAEVGSGSGISGITTGTVYQHGALFGPLMSGGHHEYWRLLTAGFLHAGIAHIALNMLSLWFVGRALEPAVGSVNFLVIYLASLLTGSFGALLFQPDVPTLGASTAIFGVFGALIVLAYLRGISIWQSGLGPVLLINLLFTLTVPNISIGGHLGGLVGGAVCGWLVVELGEQRRRGSLALIGCATVAVVGVAAAIAVAGGSGLTPGGLNL